MKAFKHSELPEACFEVGNVFQCISNPTDAAAGTGLQAVETNSVTDFDV